MSRKRNRNKKVQWLEDRKKQGKIRDYQVSQPMKKTDTNGNKIPQAAQRSAGLVWLDLNLQYWCNERSLTLKCSANGEEHQFDEKRKWRFDYAIEAIKAAVEFEGGIFMQRSGHNTAKHYTKDTEKYNRAAELGWTVFRVTAMNYRNVLRSLDVHYQNFLNKRA